MASPLNEIIQLKSDVSNSISLRSPYETCKKIVNNHLKGRKASIYIIAQNTTGFEYMLTRFAIRENLSYTTGWSIGAPYYEGDIWIMDKTPEEWANELESIYELVYIRTVDDAFIKRYSELFEDSSNINNDQLYCFNKNSKKLELTDSDNKVEIGE